MHIRGGQTFRHAVQKLLGTGQIKTGSRLKMMPVALRMMNQQKAKAPIDNKISTDASHIPVAEKAEAVANQHLVSEISTTSPPPKTASALLASRWGSVQHLTENGVGYRAIESLDPQSQELATDYYYPIAELTSAGVDFKEIMSLPDGLREEVVQNGGNITALMERGISYKEIMRQDKDTRSLLVQNGFWIGVMMDHGVPFSKLKAMEPEVSKHAMGVSGMVQAGASFDEIASIKDPQLKQTVLEESSGISALLSKGNHSLSELLDLDESVRSDVLQFGTGISMLMEKGVSLEQILDLEPDMRKQMFYYSGNIAELMDNLSWEQIDSSVLSHASELSSLQAEGIQPDQVLKMPQETKQLCLEHGHEISIMMYLGASFEAITSLSNERQDALFQDLQLQGPTPELFAKYFS